MFPLRLFFKAYFSRSTWHNYFAWSRQLGSRTYDCSKKKEIFVGGRRRRSRSSRAPGATSTCSYLLNRCQWGLFLLGFNMGLGGVGLGDEGGGCEEEYYICNVLPYFKLPNQGNLPLCKFGSVRTVFSCIGQPDTLAYCVSDYSRRILSFCKEMWKYTQHKQLLLFIFKFYHQ